MAVFWGEAVFVTSEESSSDDLELDALIDFLDNCELPQQAHGSVLALGTAILEALQIRGYALSSWDLNANPCEFQLPHDLRVLAAAFPMGESSATDARATIIVTTGALWTARGGGTPFTCLERPTYLIVRD